MTYLRREWVKNIGQTCAASMARKTAPLSGALLLLANVAQAQPATTPAPSEAAPPPPVAPTAPAAPAAPPATVEVASPPPTVAELPPPPVDEPPRPPQEEVAPPTLDPPNEEAPAEPEPAGPKFSVGVGMRTGLAMGLSGPSKSQLSLNDGLVDQVHVRPSFGGTFNDNIGFFTQFEFGTPKGLGSFAILDAIAQIKVVDEFQVWIGQHIPANDRNNMNGPFFGNTWNFGIAVEEYPFDVGARDRGATAWGLIAGGRLKYHASIVDLQPGRKIENARYAGRLTLHLLEPEAFYYNSGTYWGTKDVLAIGAVFQSQKGPSGVPNSDFSGFSFDALFEKNTGETGTFTVEAGYWNYESTESQYVVNQGTVDSGIGVAGPYPGNAFMGIVSWLTADNIGPGKLQPNARIQYADWSTQERTVFDLGLAYVIDGFNHKYHLNYRHSDIEPKAGDGAFTEDMIQVGVQYMMGM
jgi:hypothetical protein